MEPWDERQRERAQRQIALVRMISGSVAGVLLSAFPIYYSTLIPLTVAQWVLYLGMALSGAVLVATLAEWLMGRRL